MQPFALREATPTPTALPTGSTLHTAEPPCPVCPAGWPVPCPRITGGANQPTGFDAAGQATGWAWTQTTCPGTQHAEVGPTGVLETRCSVCGMPP